MNKIVYIVLLALFACAQGEVKNTDPIVLEDTIEVKEKEEKIKTIFFSLPSPLELSTLFKKEGITYQIEKLHSIDQRDEYVTTIKKSLNLGVYGADLSYAGLFAKHEDAIKYFSTSQLLAGELGIGQTFQKEFVTRLEQNANNKDTLLQVISDFFLENDIYLKSTNQQNVSSYVLAGGWIEGMYLGTHMINNDSVGDGIKDIIIGQLQSLDNLLVLLNSADKSYELDELRQSMQQLRTYFNEVVYSELTEEHSETDSTITLYSENKKGIMSDTTFTKVHDLVSEIRESIIR